MALECSNFILSYVPVQFSQHNLWKTIFSPLYILASFAVVLIDHKSVQFSSSVMYDSLWPHGLQRARLPYSSLTPGAYPNSCPSSQWNHLTISSSVVPFLLLPSIFPSIRVFSNESVLRIRWPKYWSFSFSISPSNEYSGLISFRMDWLDLLAVQGTLKGLLPTPQFKNINSLAFSFLYGPTITFIYDYWKKT